MTMASSGRSRASSLSMVGMKSSATVQQMQPLVSSTISPGAQAFAAHSSTSPPSKPASPNSLTITAMRRPSACVSSERSSVVLPAPRNPVRTVTGTRDIANSPQGERFSQSGSPAAMNTTLGTAAATIWLRRPCASRKLRPSGVSGTRPRPTSFDTSTIGIFRRRRETASADALPLRDRAPRTSGSTATGSGNPPARRGHGSPPASVHRPAPAAPRR